MAERRYIIDCAICHEEITPDDELHVPCVTDCGHFFCEDHLQKYRNSKAPGRLNCPTCRKRYTDFHRIYPSEEPIETSEQTPASSQTSANADAELRDAVESAALRVQESSQPEADGPSITEQTVEALERAVLATRSLNRRQDPEMKKSIVALAEETRRIRRYYERERRTFDIDLDALRRENKALREDIEDANASSETATRLCEQLAQTEEAAKNKADEYRLKYRREKAAREAAEAELVKLKEEKARLKQKKTEALEQRLRRNMRRPQPVPGSDDSLEIVDL